VLEGAVDEAVRNEAAFRLARIHFQKGQLDDALQALARIKGTVPEEIKGDLEFLRANVYMATGQPGEGVKVLAQLKAMSAWPGLLPTTLASRCCRTVDLRTRSSNWTRPGSCPPVIPLLSRSATNRTWCWAPCCSNLAILSGPGRHWIASISGTFSNQALLRAGWAQASAQQYDRALVRGTSWWIVSRRTPQSGSHSCRTACVRTLKLHGRAAIGYGRALELFSHQIERVDASIRSIREGQFLNALIREESRETKPGSSACATCPMRRRLIT